MIGVGVRGVKHLSIDPRRSTKIAATLTLLAMLAGACGHGVFSGNSSSSSTGGGGGGSTTRSVYVTNFADGKLSALSRSSGVPASPATIKAGKANGPLGMAIASNPSALYVANAADNTIHEFALSASGNLSGLGTIAAGTAPQQVLVLETSSSAFVYAINLGGSISQYVIGSDGDLSSNTPSSTTSGLITPVSGVLSSSFAYITDSGGGGVVLIFAINSDGTLASRPNSVFSLGIAGGNPAQIAMDNSGVWVFVGDATNGVVSVFQVSGSGLVSHFQTLATGARVAGLAYAVTPGGNAFLYVANPTANTLTIYSFNIVTGVLTFSAAASGFVTPTGLAVDNASSAANLFVTNAGNGTVSG
ncbi:MAG: hypothetical protein ACREQC_15120, partial [Candidatus Binataceae bacterium]